MKLLVKIPFLAAMLSVIGADRYTVTDKVYFDMMIGDHPAGRIVIGLFGDIAPKSVKNFVTLATTGVAGKTYKGTRFHRVIKKFMIQGGDIENDDGTGSISIYGKQFDIENFDISHNAPALVSMVQVEKGTIGSQFFITTIGTPWLDGQHSVIGKVIDGVDVVFKIEQTKTDSDDIPVKHVTIFDSGTIETTPFTINADGSDIWDWLRASIVPLSFSLLVLGTLHYMMKQLDKCIAD